MESWKACLQLKADGLQSCMDKSPSMRHHLQPALDEVLAEIRRLRMGA